jgi:hypothetical protein
MKPVLACSSIQSVSLHQTLLVYDCIDSQNIASTPVVIPAEAHARQLWRICVYPQAVKAKAAAQHRHPGKFRA